MAGIERGSIRATVLIETLPAVFQMNEILYELRDHSIGLNCGRWDYIFSYIKTFQSHPDRLLPDRVQVGMTQHFMRSYSDLLIYTCHRRGVHAMGGMVRICSFVSLKNITICETTILEHVFFFTTFHHHCLSSEMWYQLLMKVYEDIYIFLFEGSSITMDNNMTLPLRYYTYKLITIIHMIPPLVIY